MKRILFVQIDRSLSSACVVYVYIDVSKTKAHVLVAHTQARRLVFYLFTTAHTKQCHILCLFKFVFVERL